MQVSIDMSKDDETYQNRIFGEVIDIQDDTLICEYTGANYDFDNVKIINKQQAEINRLREENTKMFNLLEMVARGITLYCDTEDVIKIISAVKKFCIAKHESEGK